MPRSNPTASERTIRLPMPHMGQRLVCEQSKRFNWLAAGRRWRKTSLLMTISIEAALQGLRVIYGAPIYDQVSIFWDEAKYAAGSVADFNETRGRIKFPGRGQIICRSLDRPDNARGHPSDLAIIDEAADVDVTAWTEVIRPMLIETKGSAWISGTPKGFNWFATGHREAKDFDDSMSWQVPTKGARITPEGDLVYQKHPLENPDIDFDEMHRAFLTMPQNVFLQEMLAQFIEGAGLVFRNILQHANATRQEKAIKGHRYGIAIDWAKYSDFTVIGVGDLTLKHLVYYERFNQLDYMLQLQRLQGIYERFSYDRVKPAFVIAEANVMGTPLVEALERADLPIIPYWPTNATNKESVEDLALAFERDGDFQILHDDVLIGELQAYSAKPTPSGLYKYEAVEGHDDCVTMLRLLWQGMKDSSAQISVVSAKPMTPDKPFTNAFKESLLTREQIKTLEEKNAQKIPLAIASVMRKIRNR